MGVIVVVVDVPLVYYQKAWSGSCHPRPLYAQRQQQQQKHILAPVSAGHGSHTHSLAVSNVVHFYLIFVSICWLF